MAPMQEMGIVHGNTRRSFRPLKQYPEAQRIPGLVILKAESAIVFANAGAICAHLRALVYGSDASGFAREKGAHPGTRAVILDLSSVRRARGSTVARQGTRAAAHGKRGARVRG